MSDTPSFEEAVRHCAKAAKENGPHTFGGALDMLRHSLILRADRRRAEEALMREGLDRGQAEWALGFSVSVGKNPRDGLTIRL